MGMTVIQCKNGGNVSATATKYINAEWKLEEAYYKAQGCVVKPVESVSMSGCQCEHCESLEHEFEELIEEIKEQ